MVLDLCEPYFNTNRIITADNYFSSIPLAKKLNENKLSFVGTLRKNKKEIPVNFLPNKSREVNSYIFGFNENLTLVSYVPKINKSVIFFLSLTLFLYFHF